MKRGGECCYVCIFFYIGCLSVIQIVLKIRTIRQKPKIQGPPTPPDNPAFMVNNFMLNISPCQSENIPVCLGNYGRWLIIMYSIYIQFDSILLGKSLSSFFIGLILLSASLQFHLSVPIYFIFKLLYWLTLCLSI